MANTGWAKQYDTQLIKTTLYTGYQKGVTFGAHPAYIVTAIYTCYIHMLALHNCMQKEAFPIDGVSGQEFFKRGGSTWLRFLQKPLNRHHTSELYGKRKSI